MYDIHYWDKMLRQNSSTAESINKIRWNFVKQAKAKTVLDYGSGPGWFRAFRPEGVKVDTYDIAPWPQTGRTRKRYDLITFWDVLEHMKDVKDFLRRIIRSLKPKYIGITCPCLQKDTDLKKWKHYKPGEHFQYLTSEGWDSIFQALGFSKIASGYPECPPREDIYSALYQNDSSRSNKKSSSS